MKTRIASSNESSSAGGPKSKGKWLSVPLIIAVLLFIVFTLLCTDNYFSSGNYPASVDVSPAVANQPIQPGPIRKLKEYVDDRNNALPKRVIGWIRACHRIAPLILLEPEAIKCLHKGAKISCNTKRLPLYRFAVIADREEKSKAILSRLATRSFQHGWWKVTSNGSGGTVALSNGEVVLLVSVMELRPNYIYLHGTGTGDLIEEPPRGFIGVNFTSTYIVGGVPVLVPTPSEYFVWQWPRSTFLECNKSSAAYLSQKYADSYSVPAKINDSFVEMMAYCRDVLLNRRVTPLLCGGTALGWYRECGIIPDTTDVDFMFPIDEWTPALEEDLKRDKVLKLYWILGLPEDSLELSVYAEGVKIDLFALYEEGNRSWTGGMIVPEKTKLRWWYPSYSRACAVDLKGHLFYAACNIESFLTADYGPQWYEPHRTADFVWYSSHHNVQRVGKWTQAEWSSVYRTFGLAV